MDAKRLALRFESGFILHDVDDYSRGGDEYADALDDDVYDAKDELVGEREYDDASEGELLSDDDAKTEDEPVYQFSEDHEDQSGLREEHDSCEGEGESNANGVELDESAYDACETDANDTEVTDIDAKDGSDEFVDAGCEREYDEANSGECVDSSDGYEVPRIVYRC